MRSRARSTLKKRRRKKHKEKKPHKAERLACFAG
jgi:hypothetical protein